MTAFLLMASLLTATIAPVDHVEKAPARQCNFVDRIEGDWAVVLHDEKQVDVPLAWLPSGIREGDVLCSSFVVRRRSVR